MTDLSPAQKALAAFNERHELCGPFDDDWAELCLAAALQAVANQVVPYLEEPNWGACDQMGCDIELYADHMRKRSELLAIAAELRGDTTPTEPNGQA
jgi:hypothetical protein